MIPTLLRYPGGKSRARKTLLPFFPEQGTLYSPFFGGGSIEISLLNRGWSVIGSDGFDLVSNFWEQVLSSSSKLAKSIERYLGKVSAESFSALQKDLRKANDHTALLSDGQKIEIASKFFVVNRCSYSGTTLSGGFSKIASTQRFNQASIDRVCGFSAPSLSMRHYEVKDSLGVPDSATHIFLDPPYLLKKSSNKLYGDKGSLHQGFDHTKLFELVQQIDMPFVLTYNDCPEIRELWKDYSIRNAEWSYGMNGTKKSSEVVITP